MDGSPRPRWWARRGALTLALVALATLVAISAGGAVPNASGAVRRPGAAALDAFFSIFLVLMVVGAVVTPLLYALFQRDAVAAGLLVGRKRGRRDMIASTVAGLVLAFVAYVFVRRNRDDFSLGGLLGGLGGNRTDAPGADGRYDPHFSILPALITVGLAGLAVIAFVAETRSRRARQPARQVSFAEEVLADVLDESLDDLRAEADPRRAVIAAYARMERALAAVGLGRLESEAPEEYLDRVVDGVELGRVSARRLAALFTWARFSGQRVEPEMKETAIATLEAVRDELRATMARRAQLASAAPAGVPQ